MKEETVKIFRSLLLPFLFVALLWLLKGAEALFHFDLSQYGIAPRTLSGIKGIFFAPFIHADISHLASNSVPLIILGASMLYFYEKLTAAVVLLIYFFSGFWVWLAGRPETHIGASGIIYGLVTFLFFSGALRRDKRLLAISLLVVFLYGGLVWGIFPIVYNMSWESHLFGSVAGILCAFYFRKEGPQKPEVIWEEDDEDFFEDENEEQKENEADRQFKINYHYKEKKE